jgi:sulfofructose kinase
MNNVLMVGLSTYDLTVPLKEKLLENHKYHVAITHRCGGGPALNAACLCAKWGVNTYLRSCLGTDGYGISLAQIANEFGVHPDELLISGSFQTSYSHIYTNVENGDRTIMNFRGQPEEHHHFFPDKGIEVILTDAHEPVLTLDAFAQYPQAIRVMDAGNFREEALKIAREVDYLVSSSAFAEGYTKKKIDLEHWDDVVDVFEKMEKINQKNVIITLGERGVLYRSRNNEADPGTVTHMPAYRVRAVDTTGAGDIFHGAFVYGLIKELEPVQSIRLAQMAAAISVQEMGSQTSIPTLESVFERLEQIESQKNG